MTKNTLSSFTHWLRTNGTLSHWLCTAPDPIKIMAPKSDCALLLRTGTSAETNPLVGKPSLRTG